MEKESLDAFTIAKLFHISPSSLMTLWFLTFLPTRYAHSF
jgi:hypothetical protein